MPWTERQYWIGYDGYFRGFDDNPENPAYHDGWEAAKEHDEEGFET